MDFVRHSISRLFGAPGRSRPHTSALLLRSGLIFVLFFTLNVSPAFSQEGSPTAPMPTWNPQTVDGPAYFTNMTSRALSWRPDGVPCAAFGGDGLYYSCRNGTTGNWETITIDDSIGVGEYASLSQRYVPFVGENRSAITYYDAFNGKLKAGLHPWGRLVQDDCANPVFIEASTDY